MKEKKKKYLLSGIIFMICFFLWTIFIQYVDVQAVGPGGTKVGFAALNVWFHQLTGVHMMLYTITDWLGLVPIIVCLGFGMIGVIQLIMRRNLLQVDPDILLLWIYYVLVILGYLIFEMVPINYRPILIDGNLEASYPSSTTLLVLSVMPTLKFQMNRRSENSLIQIITGIFVFTFSAFMVIGRMIAGVHWITDIIGSVFLSAGLFMFYQFFVISVDQKKTTL